MWKESDFPILNNRFVRKITVFLILGEIIQIQHAVQYCTFVVSFAVSLLTWINFWKSCELLKKTTPHLKSNNNPTILLFTYDVVTYEVKSFQLSSTCDWNILFQHIETCLKLFQNYFRSLLQLMIIFQYNQCHWNNFEIISAAEIIFISVSDVVTCEIKHWNNCVII